MCLLKYLWEGQILHLLLLRNKVLKACNFPVAVKALLKKHCKRRRKRLLILVVSLFPVILAFFLLIYTAMVSHTRETFGTSGMIKNRFVLDTNAVIFLPTSGNIIPVDLENDLNEADLLISVITEIELFSKPELPSGKEEELRAFLSDKISIIGITNEIKAEVIALRRNTKLKLPDCIVAVTAIVLNATLLTADVKLLHLIWPGFNAKDIT